MSGLIGVTGASGEVGRRVAALLARDGTPHRLVVRDAARAPASGGEVRVASSYGAGEELRSALDGVATLLLIPAAESPDRIEQHCTAVDAAVAAGVQRIAYLSFVGAAPDSTFTLGRDHWATEEHLRAAGVAWTFLRMNLYMDFLPGMAGADGTIRGPAGDGRVAAILRDDVAASAVAALAADGHEGRTYELTGREAVTLTQVAAQLTRAGDTDVRFEDETEEQAYASRAGYGAPDWEVRGWVTSYLAIRDGSLSTVSGDVLALTGRPPATLAEWLRARPDAARPAR